VSPRPVDKPVTTAGADAAEGNGARRKLRVERNGFAYETKFKLWESRAAVRAKPRRVLDEEREVGKLFFPPELVPVAGHPLVRAGGTAAVEEVLLQRLHVYLDFTAELEQMAINPVTQRISRRKVGFEVPEAMVEDAYKICTDEAWHAQFSDDLQRQLVEATRVQPTIPSEPQFFQRLRAMEAEAPPEIRGLPSVFFTIVSETLISAILSDIPHDERVFTAVRELVEDHAEDEGRHHAFFSKFFGCVWPQLTTRQRRLVGPLLPRLVLAFLEPDYAALGAILGRSGLGDDEVRGVIEESHPRDEVVAGIRRNSRATLRLFHEHGALEDPGTREAFQAAGLLEVYVIR
jgi:P-aminobenzoate N-oxygenase AurF